MNTGFKAYDLRRQLKTRLLEEKNPLVLPGAANALTAKLIEQIGFDAVYVSGAGIANTFLGVPDIGLVTFDQLLSHAQAIVDSVAIPVVVDCDSGFGNSINLQRCVRALERAGVSAIQIEDQTFPKKCGHFSNKSVISEEEAVIKITAAIDAREDENLLIIARTDAGASLGLDSAIKRAKHFYEAGADVIFIEAITTIDQIRKVPKLLPGVPLLINIVEGGKTPILALDQLGDYAIVLYANASLQGAIAGTRDVLSSLMKYGELKTDKVRIAHWDERQHLVDKDFYDSLEEKYTFKTTKGAINE
ncbi:isocitrate lyase/PEP mutase family protein [Acidithrix ferrooxidans]|uniref:2,3-dimethylmalate lyase n=2 Tax=root TaxID=1 RepID=A0A0D8HEP2_9ACTN|nr:isocitrate lyase/PEP mutase family protein [Acidithrix ferrooxidans]KJF16425.1 2,3-dimethylmalate lyase [Acidithrix ferrooxidans]